MKGPRARHKFHIVRQWECPLCKKQAQSGLTVVNLACACQGPDRPTWMRLVEEPPKPVKKHESASPP